MVLKANRMCPYCGKEIIGYTENAWEYGSPIRNCKGCKKKFLDTRYHEIAIDGIAPDALSVGHSVKLLVFGLILTIVSVLINIGFVYWRGYYYFMFALFSVLGVVIAMVMLVDIIRIKTGSKERHFEKLKKESEHRLQNISYVQELQDAGIVVPDQYID